MKAKIDPRVTSHVNHLVGEGVYNTHEMKRHINIFVKNLFKDAPLPKATNRRFFPSRNDIRKMIFRQRGKLQRSLIDQENLQIKIDQWQMERPDDLFFFRPSTSIERPPNEDEDDPCNIVCQEQALLLVYQASWQKKMLHRYGQDTVFLDATYRTTKYALPLFFLCVHTNHGYMVVGTFIMEREDSSSLAEALEKFKEMNPGWNPNNFMIDSSEVEENAIHEVFPGLEFNCKNNVYGSDLAFKFFC